MQQATEANRRPYEWPPRAGPPCCRAAARFSVCTCTNIITRKRRAARLHRATLLPFALLVSTLVRRSEGDPAELALRQLGACKRTLELQNDSLGLFQPMLVATLRLSNR